jgi:hypothetical protein
MVRMGPAGKTLGAVLMASLALMGCATSRGARLPSGAATDAAGSAEVARRCDDLVKSLRYAEKSVAGRAAATAILAPLAIGIGLAGAATGDLRGLGLAATGPVHLVGLTAQAGKENAERFDRLRRACEDGGGPDTAATARAVRNLAEVRLGERSTRDAMRLYRDTLVILDRAEAGESEDAATTALALARLVESKTPADPEIGPLYDRALRIREVEADARPRELATVLALYAGWLRTSGRIADAEAMQARADALSHEIQAAEERSRASLVSPRGISGTDIAVGERCAQAGVSVLDRLNEEVAAASGTARIIAVNCHEDGWVSTVRLNTPTGASYVLMLSDPDADLAGRVRPALLATGP